MQTNQTLKSEKMEICAQQCARDQREISYPFLESFACRC